jgi:hypothetical protein
MAALERYLVLITWASGSQLAYCAAAESEDEALTLPTMGRASDVVEAEALRWPPEAGGPPASSRKMAYRLKSPAVIATATAFCRGEGPTTIAPLAKARPGGAPMLPWRQPEPEPRKRGRWTA